MNFRLFLCGDVAERRLEANVRGSSDRAFIDHGIPEVQVAVPGGKRDRGSVGERVVAVVDVWVVDGTPDINKERQRRAAGHVVNSDSLFRRWERVFWYDDTIDAATSGERSER